jgi:PKD repeat protein
MTRFSFGGKTVRSGRRSTARTLQYLLLGLAGAVSSAFAVQHDDVSRPLLTRAFLAPELDVQPALAATEQLRETMSRPAAADFYKRNPGTWEMRWDRRGDRPNLVQGSGVPLVPGRGNKLSLQSIGLNARDTVDLAVVEARLLDFVAANSQLLKTDGLEFQLDTQSSIGYGEGNTHWFIEFAQSKNGVRVQGANLFFRISNGNIVQFGSNLVAPVAIDTFAVSAREKAFDVAYAELGFPATAGRGLKMVEAGQLLILPQSPENSRSAAADEFSGADGTGYAHRLAWRFVFRVGGDNTTYQMMVDAKTNRVIEVRNLNLNVNATVDGGVFLGINTGPETIVALPFAAVTNGTAKVTDALGIYDYSSGTATTALDGKYFKMVDTCGSISLSNSTDGNLHLGTDASTDCGSTTAAGGAGNTRASRTGFYYLTNINRKAANYLTGNSWIASKVTANMNVNDVCNANWNGSSMNFFKSGTSPSNSAVKCANTGELPAVFLHEWGHGMDQNSGGAASEYGSGEAVGDTFAFLETKSACIGPGFFTAQNGCYNCDASCTGVRDLNAFSTLGARTVAKPSTITSDTGANCDRFACPYLANGISPYQGPMGYEGHCEAYISGSANWDLAQSLVATHGTTAGYAQMDKIWYGSLTPSKSAYRLASGSKCSTAATVDGCGSNNWYTVYLAADDDDGNLANGTPNACRIWDAFNAHGIACGTRPACSGGGTNVPPVANFSFTTSGLTANFTDSSTDSDGTIASRSWNFGDGGTSTATNPSRTYAAAGTYTVTLTVTDNGGASHTKTSSVTVTTGPANVPPTANFSFTTSGLTATFTDSSTDSDGTIASRSWAFGDGGTSTATNPSRTYAAAGTYTVTLTVTDNGGATNTKSSSVTVSDPGGNVLTNGVAVTGLSAATNVDKIYTLVVPAGATNLKFTTTGGTGDADLYAKFGSAPTLTVNDCKSEGSSNAETCTIATAQAGTYYVMVHAYAAYSGLSLTGSFTPPGSTQTYSNPNDVTISDNATVNSPITVSGRTGNAPSNASVTVAIVHTYIGDLKVDLVAPDGTLYNIHNRTGGTTDNINKTVTLNLSSEALNGTWNLRVNDNGPGDVGKIDSWSITF